VRSLRADRAIALNFAIFAGAKLRELMIIAQGFGFRFRG
jgi:hypothetical protein